MYKNMVKSVAGVILSLSLAIASCGMTAYARDESKTEENPLGAGGKVWIDSMSATATTTFSRPGTIKVTAIVYYWSGQDKYYSTNSNSNSQGGTTATAQKKVGGADVEGGEGSHYVKYNKTEWHDTTKVGKIYTNAILK